MRSPTVVVRAAAAADVPAMAEVAARSYRETFVAILEPETLATRDAAFFAVQFSESWPRMRVATRDRRLIGFTLVTDGHLDMLFVDPASVGCGAGRALLSRVESEGVTTLECFRDNGAARAFYEHHGWRLQRSYEREFLGSSRAFVLYAKEHSPTALDAESKLVASQKRPG